MCFVVSCFIDVDESVADVDPVVVVVVVFEVDAVVVVVGVVDVDVVVIVVLVVTVVDVVVGGGSIRSHKSTRTSSIDTLVLSRSPSLKSK